MNLTGKLFDYRYLIGKVVLEKNTTIRTVVTKLG
jgi:tRNA (guanine37-N1)-methyltransferase